MMEDLISIIIPVYNVEETLQRCMESVVNQTYKNLEIILINDGSIDSSEEICNTYRKKDKRIKVINKSNGGVSSARNMGLEEATGKYIGFVDSDDYIEKDMFLYLHENIVKHNADVSVCTWFIHENNEVDTRGFRTPQNKLSGKEAIFYALRGGYFDGYLWNKLYDARLIKKVKEQSPDNQVMEKDIFICEDLLFNCRAFKNCRSVYYEVKALYHYIIHESNVTRSFNVIKRESEMRALKKIVAMAEEADRKLLGIAQFKYTQSVLTNVKNAHDAGNYKMKRIMHKRSREYFLNIMFFKGVGIKTKLRLLLMYIAPVKSVEIWLDIKKRYGLSNWTKLGDK